MGYMEPSEWYGVRPQDFEDFNGGALLELYGGDIAKLLQELMPLPDHKWNPKRFQDE